MAIHPQVNRRMYQANALEAKLELRRVMDIDKE